MSESNRLLIDGAQREAADGGRTELVDPATGAVWATVAAATGGDMQEAVASAQGAFESGPWRSMSTGDRAACLFEVARRIRGAAEELAELESRNVGKPICEARGEVSLAADCFEYFAGAVGKACGSTIPVSAGGLCMTVREPVGVCGLIVPWNFPLVIAAWKVAPALAMGNTVVLKPATLTPVSALRLGELALAAGVPPGVFNVVPGPGGDVGNTLVQHPAVAKISFTGSSEVGREVGRLAADCMKRVTLELGGKSANVVFADADVDAAVESAVWSVLGNAGQDCCARSRLLVERPLYEDFVERVGSVFSKLRIGLPREEDTEIGALVSHSHRQRVLEFVESGRNDGARLVCGGNVPVQAPLNDGAFLEPALFADVEPEMRIVREEIFGPVLCAMPFDDENRAVELANDSIYGLSGSVWTRDIKRALRVARAVKTGVISINSGSSVHLEAPFGGVKHSGVGRELGASALDSYSELKTIYAETAD